MRLRKILLFLGIIFIIAGIAVAIWRIRDIRGIGEIGEKRILKQVQNDGVSYAKVKQVIDGDTIKLESGETVRYIGIDAPEVYEYNDEANKWYKIYKCYSVEALAKNKELVEGKVVRLEKDISETDKFGRLLRYVWVATDSGQARMTGIELVKEGYAVALTVPPDVKYKSEILEAQKQAREKGLGLWKECN